MTEILTIFTILYLSLTMRSLSAPLIMLPVVYISAHTSAVADKCMMSSDKLGHMKYFLYLLHNTRLLVLKGCENVAVTEQFD